MSPPAPQTNFAAALEREAAWVRRLARSLVTDTASADDAAQTALAAAWERRPDDHYNIRPWLARVVRNVILKKHRYDGRRAAREQSAARPEAEPPADLLYERARAHQAIVASVLALEEPYRSTILLRFMEGLPPREIAARLQIPVRTVNTRIQRGLDRLREKLIQQKQSRAGILALAAPFLDTKDFYYYSSLVTFAMGVKTKIAVCAAAALLLFLSIRFLTNPPIGPSDNETPRSAAISTKTDGEPGEREILASRVAQGAPAETGPASRNVTDLDHEIFGKVIDTSAKPVAGAKIVIFTDLARYSDARLATGDLRKKMRRIFSEVSSDERGEFRAPAMMIKNYDVLATAEGFGRVQLNDRHAGEYLQIILGRACTISGTVVRTDRTPVAGAAVTVTFGERNPYKTTLSFTTDPKGTFIVNDLAPGEVGLFIEPQADRISDFYGVRLAEGETKHCEIIVEKGSYISGRVTDAESGKPIEGAELSDEWGFDKKAITNKDGIYLLEGVREKFGARLYARAKGFALQTIDVPTVRESGVEQNVKLVKGRSARGRIVDINKNPIADAFVLAGAETFDHISQCTGDDGIFNIHDLRRDAHHTLVIRKEGFGSVQYVFPPREETSSEVDFGDITIHPAGSISGIVTNRDGKPVANVRITLGGVNSDTDKFAEGNEYREELVSPELKLRTDERGRYYFCDLAEGEYNISAWIVGSAEATSTETVHLRRSEAVNNCNFIVNSGLCIKGAVIGPDQRPVPGVYIAVLKPGAESEFMNYMVYMHTDTSGSFSFSGLAPGNYTIEIDAHSSSDVSLDAKNNNLCAPSTRVANISAGTENARIELKKNDPVEGIVVDRDGAPVEGASVFNGVPWSRGGIIITDRDGRFRFPAAEGSIVKLGFRPPHREDGDAAPSETDKQPLKIDNIPAGKKDLIVKLPNYP